MNTLMLRVSQIKKRLCIWHFQKEVVVVELWIFQLSRLRSQCFWEVARFFLQVHCKFLPHKNYGDWELQGKTMIITGPFIIPLQRMDYLNSSTFQNLRDLYISKKVFSVSLNASFWKKMQDGHFHGSYLNKKDKTVTKTPLLQLQNILSVLEYQNRT